MLTGFECPKCGKGLTIQEAVEHLGSRGCRVMMDAAAQAMVNGIGDERRGENAGVSASIASPTTTCRLQLMLERFEDYNLDPLKLAEAEEGTNIHAMILKRGIGAEDWIYEEPLPGPEDAGKPGVHQNIGGFPEYELWPGVLFSCVVDARTKDWSRIEDLKTKRASKRVFPPDVANRVQVNLAALVAERLRGVEVKELGIWQFIRGAYDRTKQWHYFPIERMSEEQLKRHSEDFMRSVCEWSRMCLQAKGAGEEELTKVLAKVPADGKDKQMFCSYKWPDGKCGNWCSVRSVCPAWRNEVKL